MNSIKTIKFYVAFSAATLSFAAVGANCSGSSCDGKDPVAMGCSAGAITAASKLNNSYSPFSNILVELRWSPTCKTNWTKISFVQRAITYDSNFDLKLQAEPLTATIYRTSGKAVTYTNSVNVSSGLYWSPMVYAPGLCAYGKGTGYEKGFDLKKKLVSVETAIKC